jgi:hypothetical protein
MGQGIQDFYTTAQKFNFARDYQFRVTQLGDFTPDDNTDLGELLIYARTASIPKRTIQTGNVGFKGFKFNVPLQVEYESGSWPLTFYCDQPYAIRNALEKIQKDDFDEHTMRSILKSRMLQLNLLDDSLTTIAIYRLYGWFVQNIGEIKYDLGGNGAPNSFDINLTYQYWTSEIISSTTSKPKPGLLQVIGGKIQSVGNVVKSIKNVGSILRG